MLAHADTLSIQETAIAVTPLVGEPHSSRPSRILVIEDERHIARLLEFVLRKAGYELAVCHSAEEALVEIERQTFDALVLDLVLPGMTGLELLRLVRTGPNRFTSAVIVLSGQWLEESSGLLHEAGATVQCSKPIAPSSLLRKLSDLGIHKSTPLSAP